MPDSNRQTDFKNQRENPSSDFCHFAPTDQPSSLHEISDAIYHPFMESASAHIKFHISGCQFDPVPFVRMASGEYRVLNGQTVSSQHAKSLGLDRLQTLDTPPPAWLNVASRQEILEELHSLSKQEELAEKPLGPRRIIWCHHVHGVLSAESPHDSTEIMFSVWATRLLSGLDQCPPWKCPLTGTETYQLTVDDEGVIGALELLQTCPETQKRLLPQNLGCCQSTQQKVAKTALTYCPVKGHNYLKRLGTQCQTCAQRVDPACLEKKQCSTCRSLQRIKPAQINQDATLQRLFNQYPGLHDAKKLRVAEQAEQIMLQFAWQGAQWRVLFAKHSGLITQVTCSRGWFSSWRLIPESGWPHLATGS